MTPTHPELRTELLSMMDADQRAYRATRTTDGRPRPSYDLSHTVQDEVRRKHANRLQQIVTEHGWPTFDMVGRDGAMAAWLIVQHADHDVDFQRLALQLMTDAARQRQASPTDRAYLVDRVAVASKRPQIFGTQVTDGPDGKPMPYPIERPDRVDIRRRVVGLMPIAEYLKVAAHASPNDCDGADA